MIRKEPLKYKENQEILNYTESLGRDIQCFADVLEKELSVKENFKRLTLDTSKQVLLEYQKAGLK